MKLQDIIFFFVFALLLKRPGWLLWAGLGCFLFAIPLFAQWIFFTAERLTWYGAAFVAAWLLVQLKQ